jgi:hypothetical protein
MKTLALTIFALGMGFAHGANYLGNGNTGFGGVISSLDIVDDGTNITFTLNRGSGDLNDAMVFYLGNGLPGFTSTVGFTDSADPLRRAISGYDGSTRSTLNLPFEATHALCLEPGFSGLWSLVNAGSHTFVATANGSPGGSSQASYAMTVSLADLGLTPGDSFDFVVTYLNPSNAFRSDEGIGDGLPSGNPGHDESTFTAARTYTTIPEPSAAMLGGIAMLGLLRRRR